MKQNEEKILVESTENSTKISIFMKIMIKLSKNFFLIFLIFVILSIYYIYLFWNIIPLLQSSKPGLTYKFWKRENLQDKNYCLGIFYLFFFHYNFIWFIICFVKASCSDPGEVHLDYQKFYTLIPKEKLSNNPILQKNNVDKYLKTHKFRQNTKSMYDKYLPSDNNSIKMTLKSSFVTDNEKKIISDDSIFYEDKMNILKNSYETLKIQENKGNRFTRSCRFCLHLKSDRMHHCRSCRKCFLKSDHHCYFLNNCIGFKNYKYFFCFLFYSIVLLIFISITMINGLKNSLMEFGIDSIYFLAFSITYALAIITLFSTMYLFILHTFFVSKNLTTIEYLEKYKENKKLMEKNNVYDMGVLNILRQFLVIITLPGFFLL